MDSIVSESVTGNYNSLKEDVEGLLRLVNKYVKVQLIKDAEFCGFVHSIDPIQHSIILLLPNEDSYTVNIIPGHAVLNVNEIQTGPDLKVPEWELTTHTSTNHITETKEKLISWFRRNLLPTTESGEKILFGSVSILPPYGVSNICTDNPVVAMQVRKIIENMPQDFCPADESNKQVL